MKVMTIYMSDGTPLLISPQDYDQVARVRWFPSGAMRHAAGRPNGKKGGCVYLARFIMNPPEGMVVDHIDRNPHNNQRSNLRVCTRSQNQQNRAAQTNSSSGFKGVFWHAIGKKWMASIGHEGKAIYLGLHSTPEQAARAYNKMAKKLHGKFAVLNKL